MNQIKIGKFIKEKRKEQNITQSELAEKLNVTNRSVSKWENGICMPDASIIPELCRLLNISIDDLFNGEFIDKKDKDKYLEKSLLEVYSQKEIGDKKLLNLEIIIGILSAIFVIYINFIAYILVEKSILSEKNAFLFVIPSILFFVIIGFISIRIEQTAGYYECKNCNHKYIPTFIKALFATHINRTRYMKCPKCNKYSWNKKVITGGNKND